MNRCSSSGETGLKVVQFGDTNANAKDPCWTIASESGSDTFPVGSEEDHYSNLFSEKWKSSDSKWATSSAQGQNQWRTVCITGGSNQFILPSTSSDSEGKSAATEYIGLCTGTSGTPQWISIEKQQQGADNRSGLTIKACSGDSCWITGTSGGSDSSSGIKNFQSPSLDKWKQVEFKSRS